MELHKELWDTPLYFDNYYKLVFQYKGTKIIGDDKYTISFSYGGDFNDVYKFVVERDKPEYILHIIEYDSSSNYNVNTTVGKPNQLEIAKNGKSILSWF